MCIRDRVFGVLEHLLTLFLGDPLSESARLCGDRCSPPANGPYHLLAAFSIEDCLCCKLRVCLNHTKDIPLLWIAIGREYEVWRGKVKEVQRVAVYHLSHVHKLTEHRSGTWNLCLLYTSPSPRDRTRSRM